MEQITYHRATSADVSTLAEYRILFTLELTGEQSQERIEELRRSLTAYFIKATADGNCVSFIGTCGGKTAGIGTVHFRELPGNFKNPSGRWGYIMNMYTVKQFRRRGICRTILYLLIEEGKKAGVTAFELHATKEGETVYVQEGFYLHGEPTYRKMVGL